MSANESSALRLTGVGRQFGALAALADISLTIAHGERRAILGPNGAGKTTLFNIIAGDYRATRGQVVLLGHDVTGLSAHARTRLGLRRTYQNSSLFAQLSVADNLFLALRGVSNWRFSLRRPSRNDVQKAAVSELAARVGCEGWLERRVADLSHGEQRQVELGMALVGDPKTILLDEPAAGLSVAERAHLLELICGLPRDLTVILIEHDLDIALRIADRVTIMHNGRMLMEGTPDEIRGDQSVRDVYLGRHVH